MTVAEYVQDELPIFEEPILPGDHVRVTSVAYADDLGEDETDIAAGTYVDQVGEVVALEPNHLYPYAVKFSDGSEFMYHQTELERL